VDQVLTTDQVASALAHPHSSSTVWAIANQVSDHITFLEFNEKDFSLLKLAIEECRVIKDEYEVGLTRHANDISTIAHTAVLKAVKNAKNERELEGLFIAKSISHGAREQAYHSIVAGGTAAATLHYMKNSEPLKGKLNLLLDAGAEYNCYASDIVRSSANSPVGSLLIKLRHVHSPSAGNLLQKAEQSMTLFSKCRMSALTC
jgi:Xaa-Pro dipeptidase